MLRKFEFMQYCISKHGSSIGMSRTVSIMQQSRIVVDKEFMEGFESNIINHRQLPKLEH